jgi:glyoxylase-like metal-dependent hydrolase (beta-lactamase superfamily II)
MDSLRLLQREELKLICPGHGPWVEDPAAKLAEYLEHRESRERRLLAALERGERSRRALLDEVWDDVPPELRPAAEHVMSAHLQKLEAEGRLPGRLAN